MKSILKFGVSSNASETKNFGIKLAQILVPGDIVQLYGDLGSGKTTFVKGVAKALGYEGIVNSPTYTLINEYLNNPKIIHIDCYREKDLNRWHLIGINEYFNNNSIIFIEWPEIIEQILPKKNCYKIHFRSISEYKRKIVLI